MDLAGDRLICLEGLIADVEHLFVDDGFKERRDILQTLEIKVLFETDNRIARAF